MKRFGAVVCGIFLLIGIIVASGCEEALGADPFAEDSPDDGMDSKIGALHPDIVLTYAGSFDTGDVLTFTFNEGGVPISPENTAAITTAVDAAFFPTFSLSNNDGSTNYEVSFTDPLLFTVTAKIDLRTGISYTNRFFNVTIPAEKVTTDKGPNKKDIKFTIWNVGAVFASTHHVIELEAGVEAAGSGETIDIDLVGLTFREDSATHDVTSWFKLYPNTAPSALGGVSAYSPAFGPAATSAAITLAGIPTAIAEGRYAIVITDMSVFSDAPADLKIYTGSNANKMEVRVRPNSNSVVSVGTPVGWDITPFDAVYDVGTGIITITSAAWASHSGSTFEKTKVRVGGVSLADFDVNGIALAGSDVKITLGISGRMKASNALSTKDPGFADSSSISGGISLAAKFADDGAEVDPAKKYSLPKNNQTLRITGTPSPFALTSTGGEYDTGTARLTILDADIAGYEILDITKVTVGTVPLTAASSGYVVAGKIIIELRGADATAVTAIPEYSAAGGTAVADLGAGTLWRGYPGNTSPAIPGIIVTVN